MRLIFVQNSKPNQEHYQPWHEQNLQLRTPAKFKNQRLFYVAVHRYETQIFFCNHGKLNVL